MTSMNQLKLSSFIKKVHQDLREKSETLGVERAWAEHCKDESMLHEYSRCMSELAVKHWDMKHKDDVSQSRNTWIVHHIKNYFSEEEFLLKRNKELRERAFKKLQCDVKCNRFEKPLKVLDVGSCYNPFKDVDDFQTTAIDISPAKEDVFKCDFLNLTINKTHDVHKNFIETEIDTISEDDEPSCKKAKPSEVDFIDSMSDESFDAVVFSLFLDYIPCKKLRFQCCVKAYQLLKYEGILVIVTPDSKHETSPNVKIMKQWKDLLESIGFKRIKISKLTHIRCMIFRKACLLIDFDEKTLSEGELLIPQDVMHM